MASATDIANRALTLLGQQPIASLDETAPRAEAVKRIYTTSRDSLFEMHPWSWATRRTALARKTETPAWGYGYHYALPTDMAKIIAVYPDHEYAIEADGLLSSEEEVYLHYVRYVKTEGIYPALFVDALAARVAMDLAKSITESSTDWEAMTLLFKTAMHEAKLADAQRATANHPGRVDSWIGAR